MKSHSRRFPALLAPLCALALLAAFLAAPAAAQKDGGFQLPDLPGQLTKDQGTTGEEEPRAAAEVQPTTSGKESNLSEAEMEGGITDVIMQAVNAAIDTLGQEGGYLQNEAVKIVLPDELEMLGDAMRAVGQDEMVDEFVTTMNRAAEKAVPETIDIFKNAVSQMTVQDAQDILTGPDDAATRYFEKTSREELYTRIEPIVSDSTDQVGVTRQYKELTAQAGPLTQIGMDEADLDDYVTNEALDGLFYMMAEKEAQVRENPAQAATDLAQTVFGFDW